MPSGLRIEKIAPIKVQISESTLVSVLTTDEIRELAGYKPLEKPLQKEVKQVFSDEDTEELFWAQLESIGYNDEDLELINERELDYNPFDFADIGSIDSQVIDIIKANPKTTIEEIAQQIGETEAEVTQRIRDLVERGLLDLKKTKINVTDEGEEEVSKIITVYKYKLRADLAGEPPVIEGTRDFCRRMVALSLDKSWTYEQIKTTKFSGGTGQGKNAQGTDVWSKRGGWWNRNGVRVPYCRHVWSARTVRVKVK